MLELKRPLKSLRPSPLTLQMGKLRPRALPPCLHKLVLAEQGLELGSWLRSQHSFPNITLAMGWAQPWIGYSQRPNSVTRLITFDHMDSGVRLQECHHKKDNSPNAQCLPLSTILVTLYLLAPVIHVRFTIQVLLAALVLYSQVFRKVSWGPLPSCAQEPVRGSTDLVKRAIWTLESWQ